jgi:hypothetical protein|tara:strand:+ start:259 stop:420 length:162 start_codon:yes stop_codon:yes gene_type:complete
MCNFLLKAGKERKTRGGKDEDGQTRGAVVHGNQGGSDERDDEVSAKKYVCEYF